MEEEDIIKIKLLVLTFVLTFIVYYIGEIIKFTTDSTFQFIELIYGKEEKPPEIVEKVTPAPSPPVVEDTSYDDNILYESSAGGISQHMVNDKNTYPHKNPLMYKLKSKILLNNLQPINHYSDNKLIL